VLDGYDLGALKDALRLALAAIELHETGAGDDEGIFCGVMASLDAAAEDGIVTNADVEDWLLRADYAGD